MKQIAAVIKTVGCRLNQAESDCLRGLLSARGVNVLDDYRYVPDVCYVNTCAVTQSAERSSRALIRAVCRLNPKPKVVVLGCWAEKEPARAMAMCGVDEVWDNAEKLRCIENSSPLPMRSRALLKVQDGCDRRCGYCIVPQLRGGPVSMPVARVLNEFARLVSSGFAEIVLTGLNLGRYQVGDVDLADLVGKLLKLPGKFRIRLSSIEPDLFTEQLLEVISDHKVCAHFHIPLQSGDDYLLNRMGRVYNTAQYARLLERIITCKPDACIGADVIVGFPGEDEVSFSRTQAYLNAVPLSYLHIFPYSPRPGTPAFQLGDPVPKLVKTVRVALLRRLSQEKKNAYTFRFCGKVREAVLEPNRQALTDNYLRVKCSDLPIGYQAGRLIRVLIDGPQGKVVDKQ